MLWYSELFFLWCLLEKGDVLWLSSPNDGVELEESDLSFILWPGLFHELTVTPPPTFCQCPVGVEDWLSNGVGQHHSVWWMAQWMLASSLPNHFFFSPILEEKWRGVQICWSDWLTGPGTRPAARRLSLYSCTNETQLGSLKTWEEPIKGREASHSLLKWELPTAYLIRRGLPNRWFPCISSQLKIFN